MPYYLIAAGLILHTYFWGLGTTWLVLPWRWRRWWWAFAPGLGLALQSAVVWAGAHTDIAGANQYAWWSELLPLVLLGLAWVRQGIDSITKAMAGLVRPPAVLLAAIIAIGGWFLLSPMAAAGRGVTSSSLGSCDHADYAAGARVLAEFSRYDRTGLLGQSEVTRVGSTEYFFDFWLRLNHFTPSALIAHSSTILGLEVYRLVSVTAVVLLLLNVPLVFFLARVTAGLKTGVALFVAGLYAISPLSAYAVHQGALGQLLAAQGIGMLVMTSALLSRENGGVRRLWPLGLIMLAAFWLLAGSYNFILIVCMAQAVPWVLGRAWIKARCRSVMQVGVTTGVALALCMLLCWPRFSGIVERFQLFSDYDYGWRVPLLSWDGWLGLVSDVYLEPVTAVWQPALTLGIGAGWLAWLFLAWRRQRAQALSAAALVLPVVMGWTILAWESLSRTNASYDAFKIISVFYPGLLAGLCTGLTLNGKRLGSITSRAMMILLLGFNLLRAEEFRQMMSSPPLRVNKHIVELAQLERRPEVASVNLQISQYWARLWADAFLLRKPHYFAEPTYEGRNVTPLRGEWDLIYNKLRMLRVLPPAAADRIELGRNFLMVRAGKVNAVHLNFGIGWHAQENFGMDLWRWTQGAGQIQVTNGLPAPARFRLRLLVLGVRAGDKLEIEVNGQRVQEVALGTLANWTESVDFSLPPGPSVLTLQPGSTNSRQLAIDPRLLGIGLHILELQLLSPL
jgi:hypothetical protein